MARRGFPLPFYGLLLFMSLVMIGGTILQHVESDVLHRVFVAITALSTAWLFLLVLDLDRPLKGYWNVIQELKRDVREIVERLEEGLKKRQ